MSPFACFNFFCSNPSVTARKVEYPESLVTYPKSDLGIYPECTGMVGENNSALHMHTKDKLVRLFEYSYSYINEGYIQDCWWCVLRGGGSIVNLFWALDKDDTATIFSIPEGNCMFSLWKMECAGWSCPWVICTLHFSLCSPQIRGATIRLLLNLFWSSILPHVHREHVKCGGGATARSTLVQFCCRD